ncbi:MAG: hypothetical protein Q9162_002954 [Coniocarpon cinnabarinum]
MASARLIRQASSHATAGRRYSAVLAREQVQPLLDDDHAHDAEAVGQPTETIGAPRAPNLYSDLPVYHNIWRIRREVVSNIADPYTLEQLRAPRLNTSVVRPMMEQLYELDDISIVYALLVNRYQFLRDQSYQGHYLSVNTARALLCELLAMKILRQYDEDSSGQKGLLLLANILIAGFEPFQGCPPDVAHTRRKTGGWPFFVDRGGFEGHTTALEIAIISDSKLFLSSPACQKVIDAIYIGRITYTPTTFIDIIPDTYKRRDISLYNPRKASLFNQYRLNVPRTRNALEVCQFITLLGLFFLVQFTRDPSRFTTEEIVFCIYTFGWALDQCASILEHGWRVYSENLWSFLDITFLGIYSVYFVLRMHGVHTGTIETSQPALDVLAMGAPFLIPRLAFNVFSENLTFVSMREMMAQFLLLVLLAVWTFMGFFLAMFWLGEGRHKPMTIGKWMVWVWFGLDGTGIQRSVEFHWLLGPILMVSFAMFGNTLFLTILVSTLSITFSRITRSASSEVQFRKTVLTFEGVKSDAIFAYQPPFNLLALSVLLPLRFILTPRWFHKVNITMTRILNAPLLLLLGLYERRSLWPKGAKHSKLKHRSGTGARLGSEYLLRFSVHRDVTAVFDSEPPQERAARLRFEQPIGPHPRTGASTDRRGLSQTISDGTSRERESSWRGFSSSPRPRHRASLWSMGGIEDHVRELLQDEDAGERGRGVQMRLEKLEQSTKRIEDLLSRISDSIDHAADDAAGENG